MRILAIEHRTCTACGTTYTCPDIRTFTRRRIPRYAQAELIFATPTSPAPASQIIHLNTSIPECPHCFSQSNATPQLELFPGLLAETRAAYESELLAAEGFGAAPAPHAVKPAKPAKRRAAAPAKPVFSFDLFN